MMDDRYLARISVWPYSGVDQSFAGPREQAHVVRADDFRGALVAAETIVRGIRMNPAVWQAPIQELRRVCNGEYIAETRPPVPGAMWFIPRRPRDVDDGLISGEPAEVRHGR